MTLKELAKDVGLALLFTGAPLIGMVVGVFLALGV